MSALNSSVAPQTAEYAGGEFYRKVHCRIYITAVVLILLRRCADVPTHR